MFIIHFFLTFGAKGTEPAQFAEALPLGMRCGLDVETFSMTAAILVLSAFVPELATVTYTHVMLLHHSFFFIQLSFFVCTGIEWVTTASSSNVLPVTGTRFSVLWSWKEKAVKAFQNIENLF